MPGADRDDAGAGGVERDRGHFAARDMGLA